MPKNIVVCCDGTGNEINTNLTNVLKLFRIVSRNANQFVYYDPGIGTLGERDAWSRLRSNAKGVFGLATGYGLDANILDAYRFIADHYEDGDQVFLFGFSRGAYTVRAVAGLIHLVGLLHPHQQNILGYGLAAYKRASEEGDLSLAWHFRRVARARGMPIRFIGVWDTVASVLVPRGDRFYVPSLQTLPYTRRNPSVEIFRQALAIDERRRMFRVNRWQEPQDYVPNPFSKPSPTPAQDIKQVWFAGVHSDIGGGYPEAESGLAKFPLAWMVREAERAGLAVNPGMRNHLALGQSREGSTQQYVAPDPLAVLHDSMNLAWRMLEWLPKITKWREDPSRKALGNLYLPRGEPRAIPDGARIHQSALDRMAGGIGYAPPNLPRNFVGET